MTPEQRLREIIGHLGAALMQSAYCDDEIIINHVRDAHDHAVKLIPELAKVTA